MSTPLTGNIGLLNSLNKNLMYSGVRTKQNSVPGSVNAKANDNVSIGVLTPEKTQALLNRQIADKLKQRFGEEGIELKGLQAQDFTPEKVSERILGFVSGRILSEQDKDQQTELMAKAREGIERGFAEARDILESLDVLNGKVKTDIDSTYDLIQQGLQRLEDQVNGVVNDDAEEQKELNQVKQASMQSSYSRNENTSVEIITNDGDKVLIDLFKQQSAESTHSYSRGEEGVSYSASRSISASTGLSYQVQGELDEGEQKAIDDLLKEVAKISDSFFSGNIQKAFDNALKMDFDSKELTRFSLNMDYQENRQVAISTYSNYQSQPEVESGDTQGRGEQSGLKEMSRFIRDLDHLFQNPFALHKFKEPEKDVSNLLKEMNQLLHSDEMKQLEKDSSSLLDSLVEQLKNYHSKDTADNTEEQKTIV
ncbi:MAG: DUF5610 domain-containing protein [gamma proteobacterium symbiont of Taylorina sp.]|nr:DUF5610 domain-containing protein [gamma proteobacterium symbiont of Taylorina sp.]